MMGKKGNFSKPRLDLQLWQLISEWVQIQGTNKSCHLFCKWDTHTPSHLRERTFKENCCQWIFHLFKIVAKLSAEFGFSFYPDGWFFVFEVECWQFYNSVRSSGGSAISQSLDQTCNFDRFQFVRKSNGIDCGLRNSDSEVVEISRPLKNYSR